VEEIDRTALNPMEKDQECYVDSLPLFNSSFFSSLSFFSFFSVLKNKPHNTTEQNRTLRKEQNKYNNIEHTSKEVFI